METKSFRMLPTRLKFLIATISFSTLQSLAQPEKQNIQKEFNEKQVLSIMAQVADWQIDHYTEVKHHPLDWTNGALYKGMMEWSKISANEKYMKWLYGIGRQNGWQPHKSMYHADDLVVSQMYLEMYDQLKKNDDAYRILAPTKARVDYVINHPSKGSLFLNYQDPLTLERWSWCDALFMAPPVYVRMSRITGNQKYLDFMHKEYMATYHFLYDEDEHLFYRDYRFFPERKVEANGQKIFWGRGNGWVFAGLVSILKDLPNKSVYRPFYEQLFRELAEKIAHCQGEDGYWHASLLDPDSYPNPEVSASSFFTYGLAYGVNAGLLDAENYFSKAVDGWRAILASVQPSGKLGWIQPIGEDPKKVTADMTEVYGVGAFLLAGTEVLQLIN